MWKTWNPSPQVSHQPSPVDWAAAAAAWAQQNIKQQETATPAAGAGYQDTVENEMEMEDAMPTENSSAPEWSAVSDSALEQYNNNHSWNQGGEYNGAEYYASGYPESYNPGSQYPPPAQQQQQQQPYYQAEGYPPTSNFIKPTFEEGLPPPPTHTLPRAPYKETPPIRAPANMMDPPVAVAAPRRKALPAWIRDGLSKMDKKTGGEVGVGGGVSQHSSDKGSIQRNKISGYSVLQDSGASSDEEGAKSDGADEIVPKIDPVVFVKRNLTELLLEVTNSELKSIVMECLQQEQAIHQLNELCKKKESNGSNGLDLVSYNNQSSSSDSDSSSSTHSSQKRRKTTEPAPPSSKVRLDADKENNSSKKKSESSRHTSESKPSKSDKDSENRRKSSSKVKKDEKKKSSRDTEKKSDSRRSRHRSSTDGRSRSQRTSSSSSTSSTSSSEEKYSKRNRRKSTSKRDEKKEHKRKEEKSKSSSKKNGSSKSEQLPVEETKKKEKIKELNKKIARATKDVERKTAAKRASSTVSTSSSSEEKKKKKKVARKKKKSRSSSSSDSSSSDYGYKYSSTSSSKNRK